MIEIGSRRKILDRPIIKSDDKTAIVVYSHWIEDKCIYVGSGLLKRAYERYEYQRNNNWFEIVGSDMDSVEVIIESLFSSREEAYVFEKELTLKMISDGNNLANKYYGHSMNEESRLKMIESLKGGKCQEKTTLFTVKLTPKNQLIKC